jgi:hypothetical protein
MSWSMDAALELLSTGGTGAGMEGCLCISRGGGIGRSVQPNTLHNPRSALTTQLDKLVRAQWLRTQASLLRSQIRSSCRIIDSDLGNQARMIGVYNPDLHQPWILPRTVENPAFGRSRSLDLSAGSGVGLLPGRAAGTPETTFSRFRELLRRDRQGRLVVGVTDDQPVFEHDRSWIRRRAGLSTAAEGCQG